MHLPTPERSSRGRVRGTDTLVDVARLFTLAGPDIYGTSAADSFTLRTVEHSFVWLYGGRGSDTFNLTLDEGSGIVLAPGSFDAGLTQGVVFNATTGVIANDGYGFADTLTLTRLGDVNESRLGIQGTEFADRITGRY